MIKYELKNFKKHKENDKIVFSPTKLKKDKYVIKITSEKDINLQFKLDFEIIDKIIVKYKGKENEYYDTDNLGDGLLINVNLKYSLYIYAEILDYCSNIIIKDIEESNYIEYENIKLENIYIINLKRREDRKNEMIEKLKKEKIEEYKFIEAYDGKNEKILKQYEELLINKENNIITSGHFGCLLSHIKIIEEADKLNLEQVIILEDDIIFNENFKKKLSKIKIQKYDLLYLGGIISRKKLFYNNFGKPKHIMGAYAYIIKSNLYKILLEELKKYKECIDIYYIHNIQNKYRTFVLDDIITTNLNSSDTSHKNNKLIHNLNIIN